MRSAVTTYCLVTLYKQMCSSSGSQWKPFKGSHIMAQICHSHRVQCELILSLLWTLASFGFTPFKHIDCVPALKTDRMLLGGIIKRCITRKGCIRLTSAGLLQICPLARSGGGSAPPPSKRSGSVQHLFRLWQNMTRPRNTAILLLMKKNGQFTLKWGEWENALGTPPPRRAKGSTQTHLHRMALLRTTHNRNNQTQ